jgi:hypothetical protein
MFDSAGKFVETQVIGTSFYPTGRHPINGACPIVPTLGALALRTVLGTRWYGCDRAYINSELRMVAIGFDARDAGRSTWKVVPKKLRA